MCRVCVFLLCLTMLPADVCAAPRPVPFYPLPIPSWYTGPRHPYGCCYPHGSFLWIINNIYFQYWSLLITVISAIVMVVVSHLTAAPDYATLQNLTFATKTTEDKAATRASWDWREVAASGLVLACIIGAYLYFRG